jgi:hypothetical protein
MKQTRAVTLSNENGLSRSRPSAHLQPPPTPPYGATYGRRPGRSARLVPCHPTSQRCSACAPTASTSLAATTTAHPSERSSTT